MTTLRLTAEAQVWREAPSIKTLIPLQQDQWKQKLLKKTANADIASWLDHIRISRQCVQLGGVSNMLMSLGQSEELKHANTSFLTKILRAKRTMIQNGQTDEGANDPAE